MDGMEQTEEVGDRGDGRRRGQMRWRTEHMLDGGDRGDGRQRG